MRDFANTKPMGIYEVAIGEKNQDYYLDKFEDFDQKGVGWHASWNWAAFFFTGLWALYRKMYGWFVLWLIVLTFFRVLPIGTPSTLTALAMLLVNIALWLGFTVFANSLYHRKVKARLAATKNSNSNALRASRKLSAGGGVHTWVPIVFGGIPAIGIVAVVALPAYQDYTKRTQNVAGVAAAKPANEPSASNPFGKPEVVAEVAAQNQSADQELQEAYAARDRGDYADALRILRSLSAQGNTTAQFKLGSMFNGGIGVPQDYVEALRWYRLAATQGNLEAQGQVGAIYNYGNGVPQDYVEALRWYRLAATQGNAFSQNQLGLMYLMGQGVAQDNVRAHMWLNLSSASGGAVRMQNRDSVANQMTPQQIAQAQQMARECQQRNFQECD